MTRLILALFALVAVSLVAAACTEEVVREVPVEVIVEKEVVKEVPVEKIVTQEVIKEVKVPGETIVVEKEVTKEVMVPGETVVVTQEVVKEVPVEVVVTQEVVKEVEVVMEKIVEVPGAAVVQIKEVPVATFARFGEAPMLQQLALAGSLPPVEQRLPKEPLVIATQEIGRYGGEYRTCCFTSPDNGWTMQLTNKTGMLRFSIDGNLVLPNVARKWEVSDDGKVYTFWLREGMRWSDGAPFTANDFEFQYQDIIGNSDITIENEKRGGALLGKIEKVDDYQVTMTFDFPNFLFPPLLTQLDTPGFILPGWQSGIPYSPAHYMKQWLPKYAEGGQAALDQKAADAGLSSWIDLFIERFSTIVNTERPVTRPWVAETSIRTKQYRGLRNPFYFGVDSAGNQLPYIDRIVWDLIPEPEIQALKALQGEFSQYNIPAANFGTFVQKKEEVGFDIYAWKPLGGSNEAIWWNMSWEGPEKEYINNKDFRVALALAIDREELNDIFYNGLATIRNSLPAPGHPHHPGAQYETLHTQYDPDASNAMLDEILPNKDGEGYRLAADGNPLELVIVSSLTRPTANDIMNEVVRYWADVGIKAKVDIQARLLMFETANSNEAMSCAWAHDTTGFVFTAPQKSAAVAASGCENNGPAYARWYQTEGKQGIEPSPEMKRLQEIIEIGKTSPLAVGDEAARELFRSHAENQWIITMFGMNPGARLVMNNMANVPRDAASGWPIRSPSNMYPEQWFFRN